MKVKPIKEIKRGYFVEVEDDYGAILNTFYKKRFADLFYADALREKEVREK